MRFYKSEPFEVKSMFVPDMTPWDQILKAGEKQQEKVDNVNNGLVFYNDNFRVFVNDLQSNNKNIAILFKLDNPDNIESISVSLS
jgi:hypothetical protein